MKLRIKLEFDMAEDKMKGEIGSKLREKQTLQNAAKIDVETTVIATQRTGEGEKEGIIVSIEVKVFENMREDEVDEANSELAKKKAAKAHFTCLDGILIRQNLLIRRCKY